MVIFTAKMNKGKLAVILLIAAALLGLVLFLATRSSAADGAAAASEQARDDRAESNDDRVAFLASFGWTVDTEPLESQEVLIPSEFSEVYGHYNELQTSQGYDLTNFAGKRVKRYVYNVTNYPGGAEVHATLLVYKDRVIGGDLTATEQDGLMHGFALPGGLS